MNLHDWIDELCDVLDLDLDEVDEGLVLDLARVAAHNVARPAAPLTTFLLGVAVGLRDASPELTEAMAAEVTRLAESWDQPAPPDQDEDDEDDDLESLDDEDAEDEDAEDEEE